MRKEELIELTKKLIKELEDFGIPVSKDIKDIVINTKSKARFGSCKVVKNTLGRRQYIIEISSEVLCCETKALSSIIVHELLHTCKGCFDHGKKWKLYCEKVEGELGYKIKRTQRYEDLGLIKPPSKEIVKYVIKCTGCGQEFPRKRMCNLVKYPERYRCGKCGNILYLENKNVHIL